MDEKSWYVKQNNKKLFFMPHHLSTHIIKKKNQIKICTIDQIT